MRINSHRVPVLYQNGAGLMEVLIATVVLSIGLLGLAGMQYQGANSTNQAYFRSQASLIANDLAERMHANLPGVNNNQYTEINITDTQNFTENNPTPSACDTNRMSSAVSCDSSEMASFDIHSTVISINEHLPSGSLGVSCTDVDTLDTDTCTDGSPHFINVSWQGVEDGNTIELSVVIKVTP